MPWKCFLGLLKLRSHCKSSVLLRMAFKVRFSADGTISHWWALPAWKMVRKRPYCPPSRRTSSLTSGHFAHCWVHLEAQRGEWEEKSESRGTSRLASHGEFFIGAGNVVLVTVALAEVGTSVVLSNRAWPGQRGKEAKLYHHHALKGPRGAGLISAGFMGTSPPASLRLWLSAASNG